MTKRRITARFVRPELGTKFPAPHYATPGSGAMDLIACIDAPFTLAVGARKLIGTGLAIDIQDPTLVAEVASRSGLSLKHGIRVAQGYGLIDSDYQGEIGVILENNGDEPFVVNPGDRIAQLTFHPVVQVEFDVVEEFESATSRGEGGFGHTGRN